MKMIFKYCKNEHQTLQKGPFKFIKKMRSKLTKIEKQIEKSSKMLGMVRDALGGVGGSSLSNFT